MLETPHVIIGAAIATKIPNPLIAIPLAFASHFVLETIPHWNPHLNTETQKYGGPTKKSTIITAVDASVALAAGSFVAWQAMPDTTRSITILAACLASVLPDLIEGPYFFLHLRNKNIKKWIDFQKSLQSDTTPLLGLLTQAMTVAAGIWWILV